ncbi:hypothetical protein KXV87_005373 [Aspergillus fumigatus]|nr:hypothetical protein KXV87_005373 [Aspergillus fumigatus]
MGLAPAQDAIRYKNVVFNSGWGDQKSIYMGPPSEENNQAWDDLHVAPAMVKIPASDAAKLVNKTIPIPNASGYNSGYYLIGLDDMLRKVLWGVDMHDPNEEEAMHHLDHCIEMIRQSLTCSADITVDVWAWNEQKQMVTVRADNMHTCRDFEAIRQWALERPAGEFDRTIHMHQYAAVPDNDLDGNSYTADHHDVESHPQNSSNQLSQLDPTKPHFHCETCDRQLERRQKRDTERECCRMVALVFIVAIIFLTLLGIVIVRRVR